MKRITTALALTFIKLSIFHSMWALGYIGMKYFGIKLTINEFLLGAYGCAFVLEVFDRNYNEYKD